MLLTTATPSFSIDPSLEDIQNAFKKAEEIEIDLQSNSFTDVMKKEATKAAQSAQKRMPEVETWKNRLKFNDGKVSIASTPSAGKTQDKAFTQKSYLAEDERIYIFVSSSVPHKTMVNYADSVSALKDPRVVLLMRGCINSCSKVMPTVKWIKSILAPGDKTQRVVDFQMDPFLFRLYKVDHVPAIVYAKGVSPTLPDLSEGLDSNLKGTPSAYAVYGDVGLEYALEKINSKVNNPRLALMQKQLKRGWHEK